MVAQASKKIEILIADDHPVFRQGLKRVLLETSDLHVAEEAGCCNELLDKVREQNFDIILLDISMSGTNALDTLKQLKIEKPKLPILMVSVYPEEHYAVRFMKAGAAGYVNKESSPEELLEAVRKVSSGGKYMSFALKERLAFDFSDSDKQPHELLSDREYQVFCMISSGQSLTLIAKELCLSVKTVGTHRTHILEKMKMKNNAQLIQYAILNQII